MPDDAPTLETSAASLPRRETAMGGQDALFLDRALRLGQMTDPERIVANVRAIFESDRWSTFSKYEGTANHCREAFARLGLDEIELEPLPADGRTRFGDWIMPLAWDVSKAELNLIGDGDSKAACLANYHALPDALIMQSAPTDSQGMHANLVLMERSSPEEWRGNVVLTSSHAQEVKARLAQAGAQGVLSFHHPFPEEDRDSTYWYNTWSDQPGGWFAHALDSQLFGFSLSPNAGARLQARILAGERLRVHANVQSRFFEGRMPFVSACLRGTHPGGEELLVCAHLYEHGAHDNASGAACLLETAAILSAAMKDKTLELPWRSIRFLLMPECYGTLAYASLRQDRIARTSAGVNLDGVGSGQPVRVVREPRHCDAGLGGDLARRLEQLWGREWVRSDTFELCDTLLSDPAIGVPMVWPHAPCARKTWHTSLDTLAGIEPEAIARMAGAMGAWLLELSYRESIATLEVCKPPDSRENIDHPDSILIPVRNFIGPLSLDGIPINAWPKELEQSPRWWTLQTRALWWADGRRTLGEIAQLESRAKKSDFERLAEYFRSLQSFGLVVLK
jgi:hypothetical protein